MKDFNGKVLEVGDKVIFAHNVHKRTKLRNGIITKLNIKQANMLMALIEYGEKTYDSCRVAEWNIYKIEGK